MTKEDVILFQKIELQIDGLYKEIGLLSKKNPNDVVNTFKLKFINQSLKDANYLLGSIKPYADFDVFDIDEIPTTSDVVLMLEQYITALKSLKTKNTKYKDVESDWGTSIAQGFWVVDGKISNINI